MTTPFKLEDLESWEANGATWNVRVLTDERTVLELCTCFGEPVDVVQSDAPELIAYLREHLDD
jgi:hypothetical protein